MLFSSGILILAVGVFLGFFTQTILSFAAALVAFPFLLSQYNLPQATAFLAPYYVIFSLVLVYKNRKDINLGVVKELALAAALGYLIGFVILQIINPAWLEKLLGLFVIAYSAYEWKFKRTFAIPKWANQFLGFVGGVCGGIFTSGAAFFGPLVSNKVKNGIELRATLLGIFAIGNCLRFPFVLYSHILTREIFIKSIVIFPVFVVAVFFGQTVYNYINEKLLRNLILLFFIISGAYLLIK